MEIGQVTPDATLQQKGLMTVDQANKLDGLNDIVSAIHLEAIELPFPTATISLSGKLAYNNGDLSQVIELSPGVYE
jgi:hypothetical protein